jgi:hypothetical protein
MSDFLADVRDELHFARTKFPRQFASAHEGESVIREEFEELVRWVRERPAARDHALARRECVQIAAMAMRFAEDLCDTGKINAE